MFKPIRSKEKAIVQWLQNLRQINGDNQNNVGHEAKDIQGQKERISESKN
jgi:hypothetical protein